MTVFTSNIQKGGALLDDARRMVEVWDQREDAEWNLERIAGENLLAKPSRARAEDVLRRVLRPRLVEPGPQVIAAMKVLLPSPRSFSDAYYFEATRDEPLRMWQTLTSLEDHVSVSYLNRQLAEVRPLLVDGEDGRRTGGWTCPSLLKAIHMMYYLDVVNRVEMKKCQAPGCPEFFRIGPRSRSMMYCPRPPGRKESKCASRASSAKYRERERQRSDRA